MKKKFTFLIAAMALIFAMMGSREAWGQANYSGTFTRITSADDFATGYYVVTGAGTTKALGNTANSNKRIEGVDVTINENSITNPSNSVVYYITRTENTCTFQNVGNSKYMYQAATASGKGMGFRDNSANITFEGWTSGGTGTSAYEGFAFTLNGTSNNKLKYNKSSAWFANYANDYTNAMLPVDLYKLATNSPTCTIDPTSHDFGEIAIGESDEFEFTVTTADLTEDLALEVSEGFSVEPTIIEQTATETAVFVTCFATTDGALNGTLTISGGGLTEDVTATLTATGLCTAPTTALSYTTPVELQLAAGEAEATLAPIANTGNGGTITYELIAGDESHLLLDESTGEIYTDAVGSYTVRATQDLNGTTCGGTFDIEINVTSTSPSCSVSPSEWDFGNVAIGTPASKTFTVTTANLTGDLTVGLSMGETTYSVTPTTISQSATSTDVTVTFTPVEDGLIEELLTISGGGLTLDVEVVLSATGISPYTVTYVAVNGDAPQAAIVEPGSSITLGTVENVDCNTWQFVGWSESETFTEAPTLLAGGNYTPTGNVTLYAVYVKQTGASNSFEYVFSEQGFENAQEIFNDEMDATSGIGWSATTGGSNTPKYFDTGTGLRVYNGGSFSVTTNGNTITNVTLTFSGDSYTFSTGDSNPIVWNGSQNTDKTWSVSRTCRLQKINVTYSNVSFSYSTTPSCLEIVATPTFTPNGGEFIGSQKITLACTTEGATIFYTTDDWSTQKAYSDPFTITETTTVKAKATKAGMDDSGIAEATYTKRYKVNFVVNGDATAVAAVYVTPEDAIGTLPTATAPNGYTFRGWNAGDVALTDVEPTYVTAETIPTNNMTLYAVFAIATKGGNSYRLSSTAPVAGDNVIVAGKKDGKYYALSTELSATELTIANGVVTNYEGCVWSASYDDYNGTYGIVLNNGTNPLHMNNSALKVANGNQNGTFEFHVSGDGFKIYGNQNKRWMTFNGTKFGVTSEEASASTLYFFMPVSFSNFCTTVTAISGNLAEATTEANTAYYISVAANVPANATATINGVLGNADASLLIIEDGGQLILNEKNIGVMATVKKQIEASNTHTGEPVDKWYTIGSPVKEPIINGSTGNYVADIIPADGMSALTYDLYYLDMTAGTWINYRQEGDTPGFTTLENGRGYIYSNQSATTVKYVGELNTANVNRSVNTGWNLVSNPFAQTIAFSNFELDNSASMVGYYSLDGAGGWQAEPITTVVASNTGILVNVPEGASSIEISKPAEAIENNGAKRGDSNDNAYAYIEINVANANYSDRAYAAFAEGYGLPKYDHINAEIQKVYIPQGGEDFAIAFMDENITLFPVNFKAMTTGYYTISLKSSQIYEGYNDFDYIHLIDNMTGEEIDMLMEDSYKFAASPKDNAGRFTVKLHRNGIEENDIENISFVYQNGNELVINGEGTFQLIDMLGRVVISKEVHGETVRVDNLITGAYIVKMTGENVMTQKIVIK
ncbi:MAG: InlB B-repeat-containing protein [Bacteroidia bacterium]|nr:InlB B-repeat-containing protein [Bacteroidia bacterium]